MNLYQEEIMEHYRRPHNYGTIENADIIQKERNNSCGDELTFYINLKDGKVHEVQFNGEGCAISQAAASMLTDKITGMSIQKIQTITKKDIINLLGIELGPTRLKCALLSLQGISRSLADK